MKTIIEKTADGSHTLFVPELQEHYHSVNGAIQESLHVFIEAGLRYCQKKEVRIFEIGLGTGLNALLTLLEAKASGRTIYYTGIEKYPVTLLVSNSLNYANLIESENESGSFKSIQLVKWNHEIEIDKSFFLTKLNADLTDYSFPENAGFDLVYFDAFAPEKQPEMWYQNIFEKIYKAMSPEGILVTYCAKGEVRRRMQRCGFLVERLPGPPGKREMLRAVKPIQA